MVQPVSAVASQVRSTRNFGIGRMPVQTAAKGQQQKWSDRAGARACARSCRLRYCGTRDVVCNTINQRPSRFSYALVVKAVKLTASPFLDFP